MDLGGFWFIIVWMFQFRSNLVRRRERERDVYRVHVVYKVCVCVSGCCG